MERARIWGRVPLGWVGAASVVLLAPDLRIAELNEVAERLHGCSRARARGRSFVEHFVAECDRAVVDAALERALAGNRVRGLEYRLRSPKGQGRTTVSDLRPVAIPGDPILALLVVGFAPHEQGLALSTAVQRFGVHHGLPRQQVRILQLAAEGRMQSQIADDLGIALETVKTHVRRLLEKTGCPSLREAVQHLYQGHD